MTLIEKMKNGELYDCSFEAIPSGVVAVGNPCRVLREIGEYDYEYYRKDRKIGFAVKKKQFYYFMRFIYKI